MLTVAGRDSGNNFRIPEIGSDNSRFLFISFLNPQGVPSRFSWVLSDLTLNERRSWSVFLGTTRNKVVSYQISKKRHKSFPLSLGPGVDYTITHYKLTVQFTECGKLYNSKLLSG